MKFPQWLKEVVRSIGFVGRTRSWKGHGLMVRNGGKTVFNNVPTPPVLSGGAFAVTNSAAFSRQIFQPTK